MMVSSRFDPPRFNLFLTETVGFEFSILDSDFNAQKKGKFVKGFFAQHKLRNVKSFIQLANNMSYLNALQNATTFIIY